MIRAGLLIFLVGLSELANGAIEERVRKTVSDLQARHGFPGADSSAPLAIWRVGVGAFGLADCIPRPFATRT